MWFAYMKYWKINMNERKCGYDKAIITKEKMWILIIKNVIYEYCFQVLNFFNVFRRCLTSILLILFSSNIILDRKGCYQNNFQIVFFLFSWFLCTSWQNNFCNKQHHSINETPPCFTARIVFLANNLYTFPIIYIGGLNEMFQPHLISSQSFNQKCLIIV